MKKEKAEIEIQLIVNAEDFKRKDATQRRVIVAAKKRIASLRSDFENDIAEIRNRYVKLRQDLIHEQAEKEAALEDAKKASVKRMLNVIGEAKELREAISSEYLDKKKALLQKLVEIGDDKNYDEE